jgi:exodeoxyribonuclease-5
MTTIDLAQSSFFAIRCCVCHGVITEPVSSFWRGLPAHYGCALSRHQNREPTAAPRYIELTDEQQAAREAIDQAIARRQHFAVAGLSGSGKTTLAAHVARSLPNDAYLSAPTAKAASVLTQKTGIAASTIHAAFYHFVKEIEREDHPPRLVFRRAHAPGSLRGKVLLLDEVSMVSRDVAADIIATGITIIAFGDPGQLPPIEGLPFSISADFTLTQIHRQALESPIMNAEIRRSLGIDRPLPILGEPLVCLRNARKYGLCNGAIYYASRDLHGGDATVGISTDAGDVEVHASFLTPGHEYDKLELPPGGWMTAFAFGYALTVHQAQGSEWDRVALIDESAAFRDDRTRWLYTGITRAKERISIASKDAPV